MNFAKPITGRTVLFAMLAFFGVIFAVNGSFLYFALSTFPGLSTNHAYEKGISYNKTLADAEKQNALGWKSTVTIGTDGHLSLSMENRGGTALQGLDVEAVLMRPLDNDNDQVLSLVETSPGTYQTTGASISAGQWRIEVTAKQVDQSYFKIHSLVVNE